MNYNYKQDTFISKLAHTPSACILYSTYIFSMISLNLVLISASVFVLYFLSKELYYNFNIDDIILSSSLLLPLNKRMKIIPIVFIVVSFLIFIKSTYSIKILCLIFVNFLFYVLVFNGRRIPLTVKDCFLFILNLLLLESFISSICLLPYVKHIYLPDLGMYSQIRYLIFLLLCVIFVLVFLVSQVYPTFNILNILKFPHLKENIRLPIYTYKHIYEEAFCKLIDNLHKYSSLRISYFVIYFLLYHALPLTHTFFLIRFCFFQGSLLPNFYLLPLSLFAWLLGFLEYTFTYYYEGCQNHIMSLISVKLADASQGVEQKGFVKTNAENLVYFLTPRALELGFSVQDFPNLEKEFLLFCSLERHFVRFNKFKLIFSYTNFMLRILCYTYVIYSLDTLKAIFLGGVNNGSLSNVWHALKRGFSTSKPLYHYEARRVQPAYAKTLEKDTNSNYKKGHLVAVDPNDKDPVDPTKIAYKGCITHGKGGSTPENQAKEVHPNLSVDGSQNRPQNLVFPAEAHYIPLRYLDPQPVTKSEDYFKQSPVKENLKKHTGNPKENDS